MVISLCILTVARSKDCSATYWPAAWNRFHHTWKRGFTCSRIGDDVTAARLLAKGFPLENDRGPSNATAVHPVLRDHWPLPSTTVSRASDHNSGGHWMLSKLSNARPQHTGNPGLAHLQLCLCLSEGNDPKCFRWQTQQRNRNVADPPWTSPGSSVTQELTSLYFLDLTWVEFLRMRLTELGVETSRGKWWPLIFLECSFKQHQPLNCIFLQWVKQLILPEFLAVKLLMNG